MLLPFASSITDADARLAPRLDDDKLRAIAAEVPQDWADGDLYAAHLAARLRDRAGFVKEAEAAR